MMTSSNGNIFRSPVNFPHKGQWRGALMFTLICARKNGWVNTGEAGDLRRYLPHYDVIVMIKDSVLAEIRASKQLIVFNIGIFLCVWLLSSVSIYQLALLGVKRLNKTTNTYLTAPVVPYSVCWRFEAFEMSHHYHSSICITYFSHWLNWYCCIAVTCGACAPAQAINYTSLCYRL